MREGKVEHYFGMTQSDVQTATAPTPPVAPAVNITYDKLFELLRVERNSPDLQRLPPTFFADVRAYLQMKQDSIAKSRHSSDLFAAEHVETAQQQVRNAMRILADITDRRERKILSLAMNKARAASSSIDVSFLLNEEKALFTQIVSLLTAQRTTWQQILTSSQTPSPQSATSVPEAAVPQVTTVAATDKSYEVIEEITEFFGPDMQHYGPYAKGDKVVFTDQIARILLKKNLVKQL